MKSLLVGLAYLAAKYLAWMQDREIKRLIKEGTLPEVYLKKLTIDEQGRMDFLLSHPIVTEFASEAAQLLDEVGASNYLQFDMIPRGLLKEIRVTVQRAEGMSPAEKAARLQSQLESLQEKYDKLEKLTEHALAVKEREIETLQQTLNQTFDALERAWELDAQEKG